MAPDILMMLLRKYASLRRSFRLDPLGTIKTMEERFGVKLAGLSPAHIELVSAMSDEEFELLNKVSERAARLGVGAIKLKENKD
jgi:hypothetical protein